MSAPVLENLLKNNQAHSMRIKQQLVYEAYQFLPQPGQRALYVQLPASLRSLAEVLGPAGRTPARTLSRWLTVVVKGGALAGEVPQLGENHLHHVSRCGLVISFSCVSAVGSSASSAWS